MIRKFTIGERWIIAFAIILALLFLAGFLKGESDGRKAGTVRVSFLLRDGKREPIATCAIDPAGKPYRCHP
jgi:hypothetical protein